MFEVLKVYIGNNISHIDYNVIELYCVFVHTQIYVFILQENIHITHLQAKFHFNGSIIFQDITKFVLMIMISGI